MREILVDSAGTISHHNGKAPDKRSIKAGEKLDLDIAQQRSRLLHSDDIEDFHYILVMDKDNYRRVHEIAGAEDGDLPHVRLMMDFAPHIPLDEVMDPYGGHARDFEDVLRVLDDASRGLIDQVIQDHNLTVQS